MTSTVNESNNYCIPDRFICESPPPTRTEAEDREFVWKLWYTQVFRRAMSKYNMKNGFKTGNDLNKELN